MSHCLYPVRSLYSEANMNLPDTNSAKATSLDDDAQERGHNTEANSNEVFPIDRDEKESEASHLLNEAWNGISKGTTTTGSDSRAIQLDNRKSGSRYHHSPNLHAIDNAMLNNSQSSPISISPRSALTLANSHPLMFSELPNEHDSDTELDATRSLNQEPGSYAQPLRLGKPISTRSTLRTTTNSGLTTASIITTCEANQLLNNTPPLQEGEVGTDTVCFGSSDEELDVESEPDVSQYQANVNPHYQSVMLVSRPDHQPNSLQRKIPVSADLLSDSMSSLDSMSQHSFDEDLENNLVSVSISSSVLDDTGFNLGEGATGGAVTVDDIVSPASLPTDTAPIPQYSASEEARDTRSWQKITLPDGRTREIDMKVIEPYKRVLSHGGYLSSGGHNAIVVFSACHLPDRSRKDYHYVMDNLFLYVVKTLDQLITDDYVLVYLHGGASRSNAPQFPWLKRCYQLLDRRLRKSLKTLYMVHPTFWLKSVVWMARPFISSKFWRKLVYVRTLDEMFHHVPVERAAVPEKVRKYDLKYT